MNRISEIYKKLSFLPKGYISQKTIYGKKYYYLQRKEKGKVVSFLIKKHDLDTVIQQLKERKALEIELKQLLKDEKDLPKLSKNIKELNGYLMMADEEVAYFHNGDLVWMYENIIPFVIQRKNSVRPFLKSRMINSKRKNVYSLKEILQIENVENEYLPLYSYGATITDNYWFKPKGSNLKYKDIQFDNDLYSDLSLKGEKVACPISPKLSPELTLSGSHEKCWKYESGHWYLYKKANKDEITSQMICTAVAKLLNIPTVSYEIENGYLKSINFAEKYNFEPMTSLMDNDSSYENICAVLRSLPKGNELIKQYLDLIWFDAIINNKGRHNGNCGLLRDRKSGKIISLAPNFGNSKALINASQDFLIEPKDDELISKFIDFISKDEFTKEYFITKSKTKIKKDNFIQIIKSVLINDNLDYIVEYIHSRYKYIRKYFSEIEKN